MLARGLLANFIAKGWMALSALVFVPVYVRVLGVEGWGLAGTLATLMLWLALLDVGLGQAVARDMALFRAGSTSAQALRNGLHTAQAICIALAALVSFTLWLMAPWLAIHWVRPVELAPADVQAAIRLAAPVIGLRFLEGLYGGALLGLQRVVRLSVVNLLLTTIRWGGAAAFLLWTDGSLLDFVGWQLGGSVLAVATLAVTLHRVLPAPSMRPHFSREAVERIGPFGAKVAATTLLGLLLTQTDKLLLSNLVDLRQYGSYMVAAMLAAGIVQLVAPLAEVLRPRLTTLLAGAERQEVPNTYHLAAQLASALALPAAMLLAGFSADVLVLWTGDPALAAQAGPVLAVLSVGSMLNAMMYVPYALQLAAGWPELSSRINALAVLLAVPALLWATPRFGTLGAACVWLLVNMAYVSVGIHLMHRRLLTADKARWYIEDFGRPLLGVAAVTFVAVLLKPSSSSTGQRMAWLAVSYLLASCVCLFLLPRVRSLLATRFRYRVPTQG